MKNISVAAILAVLTIPVFAEEPTTPNVDVAVINDTVVEQNTAKTDVTVEQNAVKNEIVAVPENESKADVKVYGSDEIKDEPVKQEENKVVEQYSKQIEEPKYNTETKSSNPKVRFPHGLQLGIGVSPTSGLNGFIGYNNKNFDSFWAKRFGVRFDFATYSPIKNKLNKRVNDYIGDEGFDVGELSINNFELNAKHFGALVDFYPFGDTWFFGGLRVSGGYMTGKLDLNGDIYSKKVNGVVEFELDGRKYSYDTGDMKGKAMLDWKYSGPYLGAGFDLGIFRGFKLFFDAGVVFTDKTADIKLDVPLTNDLKDITTGIAQEITGTIETRFEEAKENATKEAQDKLDDYPYYPIIKMGFMYRF